MAAEHQLAWHFNQLERHLTARNITVREGSVSLAQAQYLGEIAASPDIKNIVEVGFNVGHSALAFLLANSDASVLSFDIGEHDCVQPAKVYIDTHFPGRHQLIIGDSRMTVPDYYREHFTYSCDVAFIDGGHQYNVARDDIRNVRNISHTSTVLVLDDVLPWLPWRLGPRLAWEMARLQHLVRQEYFVQDGRKVRQVMPPAAQAFVVGKYRTDHCR